MRLTGPEFQFQTLQVRPRPREYLSHDQRELTPDDIKPGAVFIPRKGDRRRMRYVVDWTDGALVRWSCPKQRSAPPWGQCTVRQFLSMVIRHAR